VRFAGVTRALMASVAVAGGTVAIGIAARRAISIDIAVVSAVAVNVATLRAAFVTALEQPFLASDATIAAFASTTTATATSTAASSTPATRAFALRAALTACSSRFAFRARRGSGANVRRTSYARSASGDSGVSVRGPDRSSCCLLRFRRVRFAFTLTSAFAMAVTIVAAAARTLAAAIATLAPLFAITAPLLGSAAAFVASLVPGFTAAPAVAIPVSSTLTFACAITLTAFTAAGFTLPTRALRVAMRTVPAVSAGAAPVAFTAMSAIPIPTLAALATRVTM
jgi:hypothetical protein